VGGGANEERELEQETQTEQEKNGAAPGADAGTAGSDAAAGAEAAQGGSASPADREAAARQADEFKDKYVRLFAEFENFRRRTAKENFELVAAANHKLIAKLTDVLDNFELAFDPKHKSAKPEDFEKGVKLIHSKFKDILSDEGLEELNPAGAEFDPNLHDALMQQPSDTVPENRVSQVLQKGYKLKGRVLKHAKVIVSKGKE
jgi:molecular chaperone GrpE